MSPVVSRLTIALTTFNNSRFLGNALHEPLCNSFVTEVVLVDDHSLAREYDATVVAIESAVARLGGKLTDWTPERPRPDSVEVLHVAEARVKGEITRIAVLRNQENVGGFRNKYKAVSLVTNPWLILLDADNYLLPDSIEALRRLSPWDPLICYSASSLVLLGDSKPKADRKHGWERSRTQFGIPRVFENRALGLAFFAQALGSRWLQPRIEAEFFLNTGNFLVPRAGYLSALATRYNSETFEPDAACSIAFAAAWLLEGKYLLMPSSFSYVHRVHPDSYWATNSSPLQARALQQSICEGAAVAMRPARFLGFIDSTLFALLGIYGTLGRLPVLYRKSRKHFDVIFSRLLALRNRRAD